MGQPPLVEIKTTPLPSILAGLEQAGIRAAPSERPSMEAEVHYVCRRGWASFELMAFHEPELDAQILSIWPDLSRWRWWNFPVLWLKEILLTPLSLRLERDAYAVLKSLGARWHGGGEIGAGKRRPDA